MPAAPHQAFLAGPMEMTGNPPVNATTRPAQSGVVVFIPPTAGSSGHERATYTHIAAGLADLRGSKFAGDYDPSQSYPGPIYFVPSHTLVGIDSASRLGIRHEHDLFGGVVPFAWAATKVITHPLVGPNAVAPDGWSDEFTRRIQSEVLCGFAAFSRDDALRAGLEVLRRGPVRIKRVLAAGGLGQSVARDSADLERALQDIDPAELTNCGVVLEENLEAVTTYSVGQVQVAGLLAAYYGTQRLTRDNSGQHVYGGSDLIVIRGGFDALLASSPPAAVHQAVEQARSYDAAALACFRGMFASRRNYDVATGQDGSGLWRSGVLEQSWRIGGASGAELAALKAFHSNPGLTTVRASTVEVYGNSNPPPPQAALSFRGVDERVGPITKYTLVEPHGHA